jgi:TRAP-type mannitol/chloroaromatic compound transport system permease large subunit
MKGRGNLRELQWQYMADLLVAEHWLLTMRCHCVGCWLLCQRPNSQLSSQYFMEMGCKNVNWLKPVKNQSGRWLFHTTLFVFLISFFVLFYLISFFLPVFLPVETFFAASFSLIISQLDSQLGYHTCLSPVLCLVCPPNVQTYTFTKSDFITFICDGT